MKLILALSLLVILTLAEDEGAKAGQSHPRVKRNYQYDRHDNDLMVRAENKDATIADKLEFNVHIDGGGAKFNSKFESDLRNDHEGKFVVTYKMTLRGIVEYVASGGDDVFVKGTTAVVRGYPGKTSTYGSRNWQWGKFVEAPESTEFQKIYTVSTVDGVVTITVKFNLPTTVGGGLPIEPNDIKFDFDVNGAALTALGYGDGTSNTRFAVLGVIQNKYKTHFCHDEDHVICLNKDDGRIAAFMRWADYMLCDGVPVPLGESPIEMDDTLKEGGDADDKAYSQFWSIRGDITSAAKTCKWDPQFYTTEGSASTIFLSSVMILIAILAFFF